MYTRELRRAMIEERKADRNRRKDKLGAHNQLIYKVGSESNLCILIERMDIFHRSSTFQSVHSKIPENS